MYVNLKTTENRQSLFYIGILVMLSLLLALGVLFSSYSLTNELPPESVQAAGYNVGLDTDEWIPELPVRLVIPAIGVDAAVQHVGLDTSGSGEMAVPSNFTDVGWYQHGVRPGMNGSAVIAGHLNGKEVPEAVFYDLHKLKVGDEVVIRSEHRIEDIYRVVRVQSYDFDSATDEVFVSTDGKARLNLITCGGRWLAEAQLYDTRTVVFTERITNIE